MRVDSPGDIRRRHDRPQVPGAILTTRVIAIGRGLPLSRVLPIAEALREGGVKALEVTLNSPDAIRALELLVRMTSDEFIVGAGTVLSLEAAETSVAAGARFLVMPHVDEALIQWSASRAIPALPGAFTPTEILAAWRAGAAAVKLFPASVAGPAFVREMRGPLGDIPLVPTGGISADNAADFLSAGALAVGVGGWLTGSADPIQVQARAEILFDRLAASGFPPNSADVRRPRDTVKHVTGPGR